MSNIKIYVMTHIEYDVKKDEIYTPLFVGAEGKKETFGYLRDDIDDNISSKNSLYSEITGLYWIWKNSSADIIGLNHYKRYFTKGFLGTGDYINRDDILTDLEKHDIILNKRKQGITNYELFQLFVSEENIKKSCELMKKVYPEYYEDYIKVLKLRYLYPYNNFIAKKELIDNYCKWLFNFLEILEQELDLTPRILGYFAELMLSLYVIHNNLSIKLYDMEFRNLNVGFYMDGENPLFTIKKRKNISCSFICNMLSKSHFLSYLMMKSL